MADIENNTDDLENRELSDVTPDEAPDLTDPSSGGENASIAAMRVEI